MDFREFMNKENLTVDEIIEAIITIEYRKD